MSLPGLRVKVLLMIFCKSKDHSMGKKVLVMVPRRKRRTRRSPNPHKQRRMLLRVVMPLGAKPVVITPRDLTILIIFFLRIIMVLFMQHMLVLMLISLTTLFGFLRPVSYTHLRAHETDSY